MNKISFVVVSLATSVAFAQPKAADSKAPVAAPPAKMEMPKAPAEVADLGKKLAGTYKCTGQMMDMANPGKMKDSKSTVVMKLDADKAWITADITVEKMKMHMMTTYDAASKKWYRVSTDNIGASSTAWTKGLDGTKIVWDGEGRGMNMPAWKERTTEEMVSEKEMKMTGEASMDGKTFQTMWTADCKK
jgi:hypothetical protein